MTEVTNDSDIYSESVYDEVFEECRSCYGTGMDKDEIYECPDCGGEGVVYLLPLRKIPEIFFETTLTRPLSSDRLGSPKRDKT